MVALSHSIVTFTVPIIIEPLCTSEWFTAWHHY
jgi:hypothetical protein